MMTASIKTTTPPRVVALGGTLRPGSSTEQALRRVLVGAAEAGAETLLLSGADLDLPMFAPGRVDRTPDARRLVEALRQADAIVIGSPGYHGAISGLVKNALDYTEDLASDPRIYFTGRPVAAVATAAGWQGAVNTLSMLRNIVHALRGWNTPMGVAINTAQHPFVEGRCADERLDDQLQQLGRQLVAFADAYPLHPQAGYVPA